MPGPDDIAILRIELEGINPLIWRRVAVRTSMNLKFAHGVMQAVMGWLDSHLWMFTINGRKYSLLIPNDEDWNARIKDAAKTKLSALLSVGVREVWRDMPLIILRTSLVNAMFGGAFFLYFVFGTAYMKAVGFTGSTPETIGLIAAAFMLGFMIIGSLLADIINRRTILLIAAIVFLVFAIPYFYLINTGSFILATIAEIIGFGFVFGFGYGAIPTFYTENFPTRYRASGPNAGYQIAQVYGGGLIPILAGVILRAYGIKEAYIYIGALVMIYAVLAIYAILVTPETKHTNLEV